MSAPTGTSICQRGRGRPACMTSSADHWHALRGEAPVDADTCTVPDKNSRCRSMPCTTLHKFLQIMMVCKYVQFSTWYSWCRRRFCGGEVRYGWKVKVRNGMLLIMHSQVGAQLISD